LNPDDPLPATEDLDRYRAFSGWTESMPTMLTHANVSSTPMAPNTRTNWPQDSHGCVRLRNADVIELFLVDEGTPVVIEE
jgi:hypothetical protein